MIKTMDSQAEELDRAAFKAKIYKCLDQPSFQKYIRHGLFAAHEIINKSMGHGAFKEAQSRVTYYDLVNFHQRAEESERQLDAILEGGANFKTVPPWLVAIYLAIVALFELPSIWSILLVVGAGSQAVAGWLIGIVYHGRRFVLLLYAAPLIALAITALLFMPRVINTPASLAGQLFAIIIPLACGFAISDKAAFTQFWELRHVPGLGIKLLTLKIQERQARSRWLSDVAETLILPQVRWAINSLLGPDRDKMLVEESAEGLKKLHDPSFVVSTASRERLTKTLKRVDGGSIAISGSRGAGKTTLLRMICELGLVDKRHRNIALYAAAPAEYNPRDFLAELFQRLCESYLHHHGYSQMRKLSPIFIARRKPLDTLGAVFFVLLRLVSSVALVGLLAWSLFTDLGPNVSSALNDSREIYRDIETWTLAWWSNNRLLTQFATVILIVLMWPRKHRWRFLHLLPEPYLVVRAREYLFRLQIDRTITQGFSIGLPGLRGATASLNKGSSIKYMPWSFPELVGNLREFLQEIADEERTHARQLIIGIDEIDRIGSIEKAERFISEIKSVFGIDNCFFIVSIAEEVGAIFERRAIAGRSVFENAFDDVVTVAPLTLSESCEILQKRVLGFRDSFAFLAHVLSGGVPRELIRVTRRLLEMNQEEYERLQRYPLLHDLANALIREEIVEALNGTHSYLSRLPKDHNLGHILDTMRTLSLSLQCDPSQEFDNSRRIINELSILGADSLARSFDMKNSRGPHMMLDGDVAESSADPSITKEAVRQSLTDLSAFAFFALTVVDVFSEPHFDLERARYENPPSPASFDELAAGRRELSISATSSKKVLIRFRQAWQLPDDSPAGSTNLG